MYIPFAWCAMDVALLFLGAHAFLGRRRFRWSGAAVRQLRSLQKRRQELTWLIECLRRQAEGDSGLAGFGEACEVYAGGGGMIYECKTRGPDYDDGQRSSREPEPDPDRTAGITAFRQSCARLHRHFTMVRANATMNFLRVMSGRIQALDYYRSAWSWMTLLLTIVGLLLTITLEWGVISRALNFAIDGPRAPDLAVLSSGSITQGFDMGVNTSDGRTDWISTNPDGVLMMRYPANQMWGAVFITADNARSSIDLSSYQTLVVELRGDAGTVEIGIKDTTQPDDGRELRIPLQISRGWRTYAFPLESFIGADLRKIYVVTEFVFDGSQAKTIQVRNVRFTRSGPRPP